MDVTQTKEEASKKPFNLDGSLNSTFEDLAPASNTIDVETRYK